MMYSSILILILLIGLIWYLASNKNNGAVNNKRMVPIFIGVAVVAVLAIAVVPMLGGFGMFHGMGGYGYGMGARCW